MKLCPNCGKGVADDVMLCPYCQYDFSQEKTLKIDREKLPYFKDLEPLMEKLEERYEVLGFVGKGGFSKVFLIKDKVLGRKCALKILYGELFENDPEIIERFKREAKFYAELEHPNIVPIYDMGIYNNVPYLIMKYIEGKTLKQIIEERAPLSTEEILHIAEGVLSALAYMHRKGVVHRDIKPGNVIIEKETHRAILADFGLARRIESDSHLTHTGQFLGTPYYVSPEQAKGEKASFASDVYSVGITLFEMATGKLPFTGETPLQVLWKHIKEPLPPPSKLNPQLHPQLEAIIKRASEKNPKRRYKNAGEMLQDVRRLADSLKIEKEKAKTFPYGKILGLILITAAAVFLLFKGKYLATKLSFMKESSAQKSVVVPPPQKKKEGIEIIKEKKTKEKEESKARNLTPAPIKQAEDRLSKKPPSLKIEPPRKEVPPSTGTVFVVSNIEASVTVNGIKAGKTSPESPLKLNLKKGLHRIKLEATGYKPVEKTIQIKGGEKDLIVSHKFPLFGLIKRINCVPWCNIYIDGKYIDDSPLENIRLPVGKHIIEIRKKGYKPITEVIEIKPDKPIEKYYTLKKIKEEGK